MKITAHVERIVLLGEYREIPGVSATCSHCGAEEVAYGTSDRSVLRCLSALAERCPESNFYVPDQDGDG